MEINSLNNNKMFSYFVDKILKTKNDGKITTLLSYLEINKRTLERWFIKESIPFMYFNLLNSFYRTNFSLKIDEKDIYKINDMFYTDSNEAKRLIDFSLKYIKNNWDIKLDQYTLIEPLAGNGSFYKNFPKNINKIGLDLFPNFKGIEKMNFFDFQTQNKKI